MTPATCQNILAKFLSSRNDPFALHFVIHKTFSSGIGNTTASSSMPGMNFNECLNPEEVNNQYETLKNRVSG